MLEAFLINPPKRMRRSKGYRKPLRRRIHKNFLGEEMMIVGLNPKKRKPLRLRGSKNLKRKEVTKYMPQRRRRRVRTTAVRRRRRRVAAVAPVRRRRRRVTSVRRRRRRVSAVAPVRRRRRRRTVSRVRRVRHRRRAAVHDYYPEAAPRRRRRARRATSRTRVHRRRRTTRALVPRRRHRRRMLSNPPAAGSISLRGMMSRPMSIVMPVAIGAASFIITSKAPDYAGMTSKWTRLGVKAAVGVGGGMAVSKFLGRSNGYIWLIGSGMNIAMDLINTYLSGIITAPVAGVSSYGAYPREVAGTSDYGAYPGELGNVDSPYAM